MALKRSKGCSAQSLVSYQVYLRSHEQSRCRSTIALGHSSDQQRKTPASSHAAGTLTTALQQTLNGNHTYTCYRPPANRFESKASTSLQHARPPNTNQTVEALFRCAPLASATLLPAATPGKQTPSSQHPNRTRPPPNTTLRLELYHPCKPSRNLLTCPDFSASQPRGPASIPHLHNLPCFTPEWLCPRCGDKKPDLRYKRLCEFRAAGIKVGRDANRHGRGVEFGVGSYASRRRRNDEFGAGCCGVM